MAPELGQIARRSRTVTAEDIELFTQMTGDRNPLLYDSEAAAQTTFGEILVRQRAKQQPFRVVRNRPDQGKWWS